MSERPFEQSQPTLKSDEDINTLVCPICGFQNTLNNKVTTVSGSQKVFYHCSNCLTDNEPIAVTGAGGTEMLGG